MWVIQVTRRTCTRSHPPHPQLITTDPDEAAASVEPATVEVSRPHVDSSTRLADPDEAAASVEPATVEASRPHVDSFTRLGGAFGLAFQSVYACDTHVAMNCCLCTLRRCYTHRKEER